MDRCTGGYRNSVLMAGDDYYGIDPEVCRFFESGGEDRIRNAAEAPFATYLRRTPRKTKAGPVHTGRPEQLSVTWEGAGGTPGFFRHRPGILTVPGPGVIVLAQVIL